MSMNLVSIGPPGTGKGTQAQKIVEDPPIPHISTGDIFWVVIKNETPMGIEAKKYIDRDELILDEIANGIVKKRLAQNDTKGGFMLDGFPRNLNQAAALDKMLAESNRHLNAMINIHVEPDVLIERLSGHFICHNCGTTYHKLYSAPKVEGACDVYDHHEFYQRDDDKPEATKNRPGVNIKLNTPLVGYYQKKGILYRINGEQDVDKAYKDIKRVLTNLN